MSTLVEDLQLPSAYPQRITSVELLETHISYLFFAGEFVYKVKKRVDLGFLDYTSLSARQHFCHEEVRLNRRMAANVYLGVVPITRAPDAEHRVSGSGAVVDYAVQMVRLPAHRMLAALLDEGEIDNAQMNGLAELLADFHGRADSGPDVDAFAAPAGIRANALENFEELGPHFEADARAGLPPLLSAAAFEFTRASQAQWLATHEPLLERRVAEGRIRDGHGDLHAGNICLREDGIVVYDCIEFSARFRCGDVAADLAFLTMDLDDRGYPGFSRYLARQYAALTGDSELAEVESFYKSYRAVVRGKVAAIGASQSTPDSERWSGLRAESTRYLQLATGYALPPVLVLMCGLPASGKSWLARRLARPLLASVHRSDVRRRSLSQPSAASQPYGSGRYAPERKALTYDALLEAALHDLDAGRTAIVDATFSQAPFRAPFVAAATSRGIPWVLVQVTAEDATTRARLAARALDTTEASEADLAVYLRERDAFQAPHELPPGKRICVSGDGPVEARLQQVLDGLIAATQLVR